MIADEERGPAGDGASSRNSTTKRSSNGKATREPGIWLLLERLKAEDRSRTHFKYVARCPFHDDNDPSLVIEYKMSSRDEFKDGRRRLVAGCGVCQGRPVAAGRKVNLATVAEAVGMTVGEALRFCEDLDGLMPERSGPDLPEQAAIDWWHFNLLFYSDLPEYLYTKRGLSRATIDDYQIGWHDFRKRYVIPVYDDAGALVSLRYYLPDPPQGQPKMLGHKGCPVTLFPTLPPSGPVLFCEGEWDALLLRQHGFPAVTTTGGKGASLEPWSSGVAGRHVAYLYDVGAEEEAEAHARLTAFHARSVRVVRLPLPFEGDDVTDWFVTYGQSAEELRLLINRTLPLGSGRRGQRS